jgi:hypothetical protein
MSLLAFVLGCYELIDTDVWWHLKAGRWILEHRRAPQLDPFTFSSADRTWIDLHWGFQLALATADTLGGVPGMILLASLASASAFAIAVTARERDWPAWVVALCWLPALALMATRFDPRPEVFSLAFLACFLAVLLRVERHPALAWVLVPVQIAWVNMHSLFILGPIILGCYWLDRVARIWLESRRGTNRPDPARLSLWRHLAPASAAVMLGTLLNPYGIRGVMLPLELLPKIADPNSPYKSYIDEFAGLRSAVRDRMATTPGIHFHLRVQVFLLLMMAWSFLPQAVRRGVRGSVERGFVCLLVGLALLAALGLPLPETPAWLSRAARAVPAVVLIAGAVAAVRLAARSQVRATAATMAVGAVAAAAWALWLRAYLFDEALNLPGALAIAIPSAAAGFGVLAAVAIVRDGGSLFRMLLAVAFTYLSFQAVRNINLFAMVGGAVLAWNLGESSASIAPARPHRRATLLPRALVLAMVSVWSLAVATNGYYAAVGDDIRFGLRERPWTFAHEAARFAGRPGLPRHALAFHLGQAGVYIDHNGPDRKVYIDGRLEVPSSSTFQNYVRIQDLLSRNDPRWDVAVSRLGDPLILIRHDGWTEAEATLLAHPRWRCLHFDPVASIFVPRSGPSSAPSFPDFDFTSRPQPETAAPSGPTGQHRLSREAETLFRLGSMLRRRGGDPWRSRIPILIGAAERVRAMLLRFPTDQASWNLLGFIEWEMVPDLTRPPPGPDDPWDPAVGLAWARATYGFRRALEMAPGDVPTRKALAACFGVRRMSEARRRIESLPNRVDQPQDVFGPLEKDLGRAAGSPWPQIDRNAATFLHLGHPDAARQLWTEATDPPSPALRWTRMAAADLAAFDPATAASRCRLALKLDSHLGEAWYVLTVALFEAGRSKEALDACRESRKHPLTAAQREHIDGLETMLGRRS